MAKKQHKGQFSTLLPFNGSCLTICYLIDNLSSLTFETAFLSSCGEDAVFTPFDNALPKGKLSARLEEEP